MRVDILTLYAYSDKAHAKQRELWRGFLALVIPVLIELDPHEFERLLENAQCRSLEQLLEAVDKPEDLTKLIWSVSGQFSEVLGFDTELGLAAFLDVSLPTRVHSIGLMQSSNNENAVVTSWLRAFREIQKRPEFIEITQEWKRSFEMFLEEDESGQTAENEGESGSGTESPEVSEVSASAPPEHDPERRTRKRRKTG